jgi:predicted Fe-Mo cluster-binding NifX family protein
MKIVLTTTSPNIQTALDPRFGRGAYLVTLDTDTQVWEAHENPGVNASGGAGIMAAQFVAAQGAQAVLSGDFGPHAFAALQAAKVTMYLYGDSQSPLDAIDRLQARQLQAVSAATCDEGDHGRHEQDA